ncbi:hypothetical protein AXG93_789s1010 [Marchantia polymorpha subsp. ruderalis]|uniref:Uncharacterized protein n=1 Tax=Marchantia polymorpha subsp. ruderalis TaxID=1480154 RepID=A0A176VGK1_MARPO|nr:hypothetical protein AXG93_789s1010 [Marchantia polymorpha subsp. ruderalis]
MMGTTEFIEDSLVEQLRPSVVAETYWKSRSVSPRKLTTMDPRTQASMGFPCPRGLCSPDPRSQEIEPSRAESLRKCRWKQKSDSVHELSSASEKRTDVVFFHGLRLGPAHEAHLSTWKSRSDTPEVWLKWLHEDNPSLRIIAVSYDASMKKDSKNGRMDIFQVSENLLHELIMAGVGKTGPVIFVGHSFGGIIAKEICRQAHLTRSLGEDIPAETTLLHNLRGLFFFGVPHRGSSFTDVLEEINFEKGELVDYVKVFSKDLARLNHVFDRLCEKYEWRVAGVGESLPTLLVKKTATDEQALPKIQVGRLKSLEGEEIQQLLEKGTLGFWGMVGVGKTTLCKAVFNDLWNEFPYTLFAEGVKRIPGDEKEFEETVLSFVHHKGKKMAPAPNLVQLRGKKLLVAFDDVEKEREIDLLRKLSRLSTESSRYIVTSQNRQMLFKIDSIHIYEVERLHWEDSKLLFKKLAFPDNQPLPKWQQECMEDVVQKCGGLPLTLEVVANYLKGCNSKDVWQQLPNYLVNAEHGETVGLDKVWMLPKISYDNLRPEAKQMFLEAATFFQERLVENHGWRHGQRLWTLSEAKLLWSMMYGNEALHWRTLVDRSLVSDVPEDSAIRVHELLKRLGHSLADTDGFKIRVDSVGNLIKILHDGKCKIKNVHTLQVVCKETSSQFLSPKLCIRCFLFQSGWISRCEHLFEHLPSDSICNMESLRFLQLVDCEFEEGKVILPRSVVVFSSQNSGKYISFPESSPLVYLSMKAFKIERLPESVCGLSNLRFLHLEAGNLLSLPDNFGNLKKLQQLKLVAQRLKELPASFGWLEDLRKVHLDCDQLKCLPETIGLLRQLQELNLGCDKLVSLPLSIGQLVALQDLSLRCNALEELPDPFGALVGLRKLELQCDELLHIPESIASLKQLRELILLCRKLRSLPQSFGELEALQDLCLQCDSLESLPDSLDDLQALQKLNLKRLCSGLSDTSESKVEYVTVFAYPGVFRTIETFELHVGNPELNEYYQYSELRV